MVGLNLSLIDRRGTSKALFALLLAAFHTANHFLFVLETFPRVMMSAFAAVHLTLHGWTASRAEWHV